jgi:hypothetical protein
MMMMARITNVPAPFQAKVVGQIEHSYDQVAEWMSLRGRPADPARGDLPPPAAG